MQTFFVHPVGVVSGGGEGPAQLRIDPAYRDGLRGLEGFGHAVAIWWAHEVDDPELRALTDAGRPYTRLDHDLGIFATRSPLRPNPLALTAIELAAVDADAGIVETPYLDAADGTPVLDLKPYTPQHRPHRAPHRPRLVRPLARKRGSLRRFRLGVRVPLLTRRGAQK